MVLTVEIVPRQLGAYASISYNNIAEMDGDVNSIWYNKMVMPCGSPDL